jgi:hypothetical protein
MHFHCELYNYIIGGGGDEQCPAELMGRYYKQ